MASRKLIITSIAAAAGICVLTFATASSHDKGIYTVGQDGKEKILSLNDTLTNEMSDIPALAKMDRLIENYRRRWDLQGVSVAVMRNDSLVYAKGYGWADMERGERMNPGNILRMASVSKLITATGIMKLKEMGKLSLQDTVFGPSGILNDSIYTASIGRKRNYIQITV